MEKKEMRFIEKFAAAGIELNKAMVESNKDAMIMIATSELNDERRVSSSIKGESGELSTLLAYVAIKDKDFKTILTKAIMCVESWEQKINKDYGKE